LPLAPFPKISTLCEVLRTDKSVKNEGKSWEIALKFLVLNDYDRDFLINYIFTKERERLRAREEDGS
jgi:c-di-GMP-binding flagellar brake protein YcgR